MATEGEWYIRGNEIFDSRHYSMAICNHTYDDGNEIARRIVTAVNCHEELVGLVDMVRCAMEANDSDLFLSTTVDWLGILACIDAVLAKAKGDS